MIFSELVETRLGEFFAFITALTWSCAVILFKKSGERVHPAGLNQFKNVLTVLLLVPTMLLLSMPFFPTAPVNDYLLLIASGIIGIGIADTLFFRSLNLLGAGRSAIVDCLYSPSIIGLSILFLGESLNLLQGTGALLIVSAVLAIAGEREQYSIDREELFIGILLGALAMITMAVGVVLAKPVLERHDVLWVTLVRLVGGISILFLYFYIHPERKAIIQSVVTVSHRGYTLAGSFMGGYVSLILWLSGMKYTQASIAAALNQTSNIFVFIFAAIFLKEKITPIRIGAITLGITGAIMVGLG